MSGVVERLTFPAREKKQFSIVNHRLVGEGVVHVDCGKNTQVIAGPDMIILHYTAGSSVMSSVRYLARPDVAASAHLVIGRAGEVVQLVAFNIVAWHAGRSRYAGRSELNHCSLGIELDNLGQLRQEGGKFVAECGVVVPFDEVYVDEAGSGKTYWHKYTEVQERVLAEVCGVLTDCYSIQEIVGHSDVTERKVDPGPALRLPEWMRWY